ncbi:MAG: bifunctional pyr operon transcriptional regulator/uracil phosphoribosyltransferase PyrR [Bacteroidetes bacterium]|nr:bifunctional pyr operon transcriptional regulator/uracil phosphoribosyltransferase PyrR [Bacteroidota bacterium]
MNLKIMSSHQVERTLTRLAYEIIERNRGAENIIIFGIKNAGAQLARSLADRLASIELTEIQAHDLDVTAFRDDSVSTEILEVGKNGLDVTDRDVILVDDVLFTGRTVRAALDAVVRFGRPRSIQLMVLIDRGHREYPIQPDYVGKVIPTKHLETVRVEQGEEITVLVVD